MDISRGTYKEKDDDFGYSEKVSVSRYYSYRTESTIHKQQVKPARNDSSDNMATNLESHENRSIISTTTAEKSKIANSKENKRTNDFTYFEHSPRERSGSTKSATMEKEEKRKHLTGNPLKLFKKLTLKSNSEESEDAKPKSNDQERKAVRSQSNLDEVKVDKLPQVFIVKYLGQRESKGLWGIQHTREPVDLMVAIAKSLKPTETLPYLQLHVSEKGVHLSELPQNQNKKFQAGLRPIDSISYGVQDVVYTRVFAMIVVNEHLLANKNYFECHAFVCDSRYNARRLAYSLAKAFEVFSHTVTRQKSSKSKKFAIDLRTPEEIEEDLKSGTELDSEA